MANEPNDKLTEELAKFFIAAWDHYQDNSSLEFEWILQETDLMEVHEVTQDDVDSDCAPEDHAVGDTCYILSPLGKEALRVVMDESDRRKAALGVVKPQSTRLPFPLSGQPPCAKHPSQNCLSGCEFGIAGPCLREQHTQGDAP
jgi:hypothetical protein